MSNMGPGESIWLLAPELACESPIEEAFLHGLVAASASRRLTTVVVLGDNGDPVYPVTEDFGSGHILYVRQQVKVERFRFDFRLAVFTIDDGEIVGRSRVLVVECDGHEYHERTKEQALRDRSRDRIVQGWGLSVFRFTGRELHRGAEECARECLDFLGSAA